MRPLADIIYAACSNPATMMPCHPTPEGRRKIGENIKNAMREARRFYVDEDATRSATKLGIQHPDILLSMLKRARLPFQKIWVEWDVRAQIDEAGANGASAMLYDDTPERTGCLIERMHDEEPLYRLTALGTTNENPKHVVVSTIGVVYHLNQPINGLPMTSDQRLISDITQFPDDYIQKSLIGGAYLDHEIGTDNEQIAHRKMLCDNLSSHATNVLAPWMASAVRASLNGNGVYNKSELMKIIRNEVVEHSGTWRLIISLLALINSRDYVESEKTIRQGKNRSVGAKVVPYLDHWLVKLKLPRKIVEARVLREMAETIPKRRHEVIGHFKQSRKKGLPGCEHVYVEETATREVCIIEGCGHRKWWVNEFMRGDASIGFVTKDRLVTET
jgi:hypothetical protein